VGLLPEGDRGVRLGDGGGKKRGVVGWGRKVVGDILYY